MLGKLIRAGVSLLAVISECVPTRGHPKQLLARLFIAALSEVATFLSMDTKFFDFLHASCSTPDSAEKRLVGAVGHKEHG